MNLALSDGRWRRAFLEELPLVAVALILVLTPVFVALQIIAVAALAGNLLIALRSPRALVLSVPFAIPMSFEPFEVGTLQFNVLEILVVAAVIGYSGRFAFAIWRERGKLASEIEQNLNVLVPDRVAMAIAGLLLLGSILSTIWLADPNHLSETLRTLRWTILFPIAYFVVAGPILNSEPFRRVLVAALFLAGAVMASLIALFDGLFGGGIQADSVTRLSGMAPHPNALALVLVRAAVLGLLIGLLTRDRLNPRWLIPASVVAGVTLLTFSRGAFIGMVTGLLLILVLARARRIALLAAAAAAVVLGGIVLIAPERTLSLLGGGSGSLRIELWSSSLRMIRDNLLTGVGLDQFLYTYLPRYVSPEAWPERFTSHPHNIVLDSWLSLGIIGPVVVGLTILLATRHLRAALRVGDRISLGAIGALVAVLIHGMVDQSYFLPELAMSVWLLILLIRPDTRDESHDHTSYRDSETRG